MNIWLTKKEFFFYQSVFKIWGKLIRLSNIILWLNVKLLDYLMYLPLIIDTLETKCLFLFTKIWSSPVAVLSNIIQNSVVIPIAKGIKRDLIIKMKTISKDSFYYRISSWAMRLAWTVWGFRGAVHGWALCIKFLVWFLWSPTSKC